MLSLSAQHLLGLSDQTSSVSLCILHCLLYSILKLHYMFPFTTEDSSSSIISFSWVTARLVATRPALISGKRFPDGIKSVFYKANYCYKKLSLNHAELSHSHSLTKWWHSIDLYSIGHACQR